MDDVQIQFSGVVGYEYQFNGLTASLHL